ncbi:MAG: acyl--CoA ligase [Clostridia bacterium]|nr:acyl--CoA ligase [Clostridia bacterium]
MFRSIVEAVFSHAEAQPDKLCLIDEARTVTYSQYKAEICRLASALGTLGIEKGEKIVVEASQTIDFLALELAIQLIGAIFVPVERNCAWDKTLRIASSAEAKFAVTLKKHDSSDEVRNFAVDEITEAARSCEPLSSYELPEEDTVSELLFSTGTTGKEKGIVISHKNDIAIAENIIHGVKMLPDNVEMDPSPLNHSFGLRRYYGNMVNGSTVVLVTGVMNVMGFFRMMDTYGVNSICLVPTALTVLLRLSKGKFAEYKDTMRYIQFGSAPLADGDKASLRSLLPDTRLYNFYGSTESGCICIYDFNTDNDKPKCIGKPAYNAKIIIVDENRNEITSSAENTGLLASFGKMNMSGYWKDEEETKRVLIEGGIYSNDEAYFDEDGDIVLLGRKGDVINVGGNKVSPDEIEDVAKKHPDVEDCGCIGIKDALKGSVPKLYIQVKRGADFDSVSIRNHLASNLEPYKVPAIIEQIDVIPRSFNGKLLRRALRSQNED